MCARNRDAEDRELERGRKLREELARLEELRKRVACALETARDFTVDEERVDDEELGRRWCPLWVEAARAVRAAGGVSLLDGIEVPGGPAYNAAHDLFTQLVKSKRYEEDFESDLCADMKRFGFARKPNPGLPTSHTWLAFAGYFENVRRHVVGALDDRAALLAEKPREPTPQRARDHEGLRMNSDRTFQLVDDRGVLATVPIGSRAWAMLFVLFARSGEPVPVRLLVERIELTLAEANNEALERLSTQEGHQELDEHRRWGGSRIHDATRKSAPSDDDPDEDVMIDRLQANLRSLSRSRSDRERGSRWRDRWIHWDRNAKTVTLERRD